jgi:hypothetical protein
MRQALVWNNTSLERMFRPPKGFETRSHQERVEMSEPAETTSGPTIRRRSRLASLDARLAIMRMQNGYAGGMPPLVAAQLAALQSDIRGQLATSPAMDRP